LECGDDERAENSEDQSKTAMKTICLFRSLAAKGYFDHHHNKLGIAHVVLAGWHD
jgi:hypothetical protein